MKERNGMVRRLLDALDEKETGKVFCPGIETQIDYIQSTHSHEFREYSEEETAEMGKVLLSVAVSDEDRKRCLGVLAHLGTVGAYKILTDYQAIAEGDEMKMWAELARQECRMFLEMELSGEPQMMITGGLGGDDERLRFYYMVLPLSGHKFQPGQDVVVRIAFEEVASKLACEIEDVVASPDFCGIRAMVPLDVAPADLVVDAIEQCNQFGEFVLEDYYCTNMKIPDEEEVKEIISLITEYD
jgi:hypothetical protein